MNRRFIYFFLLLSLSFACTRQDTDKPQVKSKEVWGIDLSHHQGQVNWEKFSKHHTPHFIYLKATEGVTHIDREFYRNLDACRKRNYAVGAYHFFSFKSDGKEQAKWFLKIARPQKNDLFPVVDVEMARRMPTKEWIEENLKDFCHAIESEVGVVPIIYCSPNFYQRYLSDEFSGYHLWIADYQWKPRKNWLIWQHTDGAKFKGISGNVDRNIFNHEKKNIDHIRLRRTFRP
ncbi:MAG: hypothetical protein LWX70_07810 [Sphingobacteriia bacterium]|nr:hypothetical protein [Sphingobacteriia bacterium]